MSSNVGQNYPYATETEEERAAAVERALATFDGLRAKVEAETTPLGHDDPDELGAGRRWFVYVCPRDDFRGRLHTAGFALEKHAPYMVCDTCGHTFLR